MSYTPLKTEELQRLEATVSACVSFETAMNAITRKIRNNDTDGLQEACEQAIPALDAYKQAMEHLYHLLAIRKRLSESARTEMHETLEGWLSMHDLVILGGARGDSPEQIRSDIGPLADLVLKARAPGNMAFHEIRRYRAGARQPLQGCRRHGRVLSRLAGSIVSHDF